MKSPQTIQARLNKFRTQLTANEAAILQALSEPDMDEVCMIVQRNRVLHDKISLLEWCLKD